MGRDSHPVTSAFGFVYLSGSLKEMIVEFGKCMQGGQLGLLCYAPTSFGLSTAARFIAEQIMQSAAAVTFTLRVDQSWNSRDQVEDLWRSILQPYARSLQPTIASPYSALLNLVTTRADELGTDRAVLVLDDAHNLSHGQLAALKGLDDDLRHRGLSTFILRFAQPAVLASAALLRQDLRSDLAVRFFKNRHRLRGLREDEVSGLLRYYDQTIWPTGSEMTFTQAFAPKLWSAGFRLESMEATAVQSIRDSCRRVSSNSNDFGISYLTSALRQFLTEPALRGQPSTEQLAGLMASAIERSGWDIAFKLAGTAEEDAQRPLTLKSPLRLRR